MIELSDLCHELNNYFAKDKFYGRYTITDGQLDLSELVNRGSLQDGQFFRIIGSVFNDGVYRYPCYELTDETFDGSVWTMAVPRQVTSLLAEIDDWTTKYADKLDTPYQSESFGGYSYSKGSGNAGTGTDAGTWQNQFHSRLNRWRRVRAIR